MKKRILICLLILVGAAFLFYLGIQKTHTFTLPPSSFHLSAAPSSGCPGKEDLFSCPACSCVQRLPATDPDSSGPGYGDPGRSRDPLPHRRLPDAVFHRDRIFTPRTVAPRLSPALPYGCHGDDHRSPGSVRLPSLPGLRNRRRCHPGFRRHMRHLPDPGRDCLRMARGKKEPYRRCRQQPKGSRGPYRR